MSEVIKEIPAVPKTVIKPIDAVQATPVAQDPITKKIAALLEVYKTSLTGRQVSRASAKTAATNLLTATNLLIANPTKENFTVFWDFHKANKDGVCRETVALTGLDTTTTDRKAKLRVAYLYNTFRDYILKLKNLPTQEQFTATIPAANLYRYLTRAR